MRAFNLIPNSILEKLSVTPTNCLGEGADGEVFEIQEDLNKVIKFSVMFDFCHDTLDKEYDLLSITLNHILLNYDSTIVKLFAFNKLGTFSSSNQKDKQLYLLHYSILEKCFPLSEDENKVLKYFFKSNINNIDKILETLTIQNQWLDFDLDKMKIFFINRMNSKIRNNDLNSLNIMKDSFGNFKSIDLDRFSLHDV